MSSLICSLPRLAVDELLMTGADSSGDSRIHSAALGSSSESSVLHAKRHGLSAGHVKESEALTMGFSAKSILAQPSIVDLININAATSLQEFVLYLKT